MVDYNQELDACGLSCPLPLLRTKKTLQKMESGEVLRVIATDPGSVTDLKAFSIQSGNELLEFHEENGVYYYLLRKS